jgi:putative tricarboxylic transport membrane protein
VDLLWPGLASLLFDPTRLGVIAIGVIVGFIAGLIPGIGGRIGILLALPFAISMEPLNGALFLIAMHSVVHTSGAIPPLAYGLATSSSEVATAIEGFQLRRQGRSAEALGASLGASAIGGIAGVIAYFAVMPVIRPIVLNFGAPEFLLLSMIGLSLVAALTDGNLRGGLAVGALGLLASTIGVDILTGDPRFTFGRLELWDGIQIVAVVGGFFVVPEMLEMLADPPPPHEERALKAHIRDVVAGMFSVARHKIILLRSSIIGILVGVTPGVGASVSVWLSYADAARLGRDSVPFGQGAISGVIAPEAANNSKEGGAMVPTVFFGIPGSSGMAILMGGMAALGIQLGPEFLGPKLETAFSFGWTIALANLLAVPLFFLTIPLLVRWTQPRPETLVPFAFVASVSAAWAALPGAAGMAEFAIASAVGILLRAAGLARAPLLLGLVMGPIAEKSLSKTVSIWGFEALMRPGTMILGAILIYVLIGLRRPSLAPRTEPKRSRQAMVAAYAGIIAIAVAAILVATQFKFYAALAPVSAAILAGGFACLALVHDWRALTVPRRTFAPGHLAVFAALVLLAPAIGLLAASAIFLAIFLGRMARLAWGPLIVSLSIVLAMQWLLVGEALERHLDFGWSSRLLSLAGL